ncbi:uncharacterized protein [Typha angustifolia]|uniref:uncharacterized protein n=1 Tax=Typha angustifolia TaxID=59011 RepID=UPI003C2D1286
MHQIPAFLCLDDPFLECSGYVDNFAVTAPPLFSCELHLFPPSSRSLSCEMLRICLLNPLPKTLVCDKGNLTRFTSPRAGTHLSSFPERRCAVNKLESSIQRRGVTLRCSPGQATGDQYADENPNDQEGSNSSKGFLAKWLADSAEMRSRVAKLGLSAVLAYGLFDGVTYTTFFFLAFLGYEKSTGKNPAANLQALLGIVILMWTGNNITRPFRVAGAAALAPVIDKGLKRIQEYFNFPSLIYAFALVVAIVAGSCLTLVGLLILSRWGK